MLAAQAHGDLRRQAAQNPVLGIDQDPLLLDFPCLGGIGFHAGKSERVRILHKKMARLAGVAPNPPLEEGGGDKSILALVMLLCDAVVLISQKIRSSMIYLQL
jgi:hypothetical protein